MTRIFSSGAPAAALGLILLLQQGCGLTVTSDRPAYDDLDATEQAAVNIVLAELRALETKLEARSKALFGRAIDLGPVVSKERIHVAFEGRMLALNVGDGAIHIATWENLSDQQRKGVQASFKTTAAKAKVWYEKLFYRVMAASNGIKQWIFNVNSPGKAFGTFNLFNMEVHPMRTAMGYFANVGRSGDIWNFTAAACSQVLAQGKARFGQMFTEAQSNSTPRWPRAKAYMNEHLEEFFEAADPTTTLYYICQWTAMGKDETEPLDAELRWLHSKLK